MMHFNGIEKSVQTHITLWKVRFGFFVLTM